MAKHKIENHNQIREDCQTKQAHVQRLLQDLLSEAEKSEDVDYLINLYVDRLMEEFYD